MRLTIPSWQWWGYGGAIGLTLLSAGLMAWRLPGTWGSEGVPYHANIYVGIDGFGAWWRLYLLPGFVILFALLNVLLARTVWRKKPFHVWVLLMTTLFLAVLNVIGIFFLILVNLSYG